MTCRGGIALLAALLGVPAMWAQQTVYVNGAAGNDAWDGLCEEWDGGTCGPKKTIQAGIDAAVDGDEVLVADGSYYGWVEGNIDLDFGGKAIAVRSQGGPAGCVIDCADRGRAFHFHSGETHASVVEGFTISDGGVDDDSPGGGAGGGILCRNSSPTIRDCRIIDCQATSGVYDESLEALALGGGICCESSDAIIQDCVLTYNKLYASGSSVGDVRACGGGIYCGDSNAIIMGCEIRGSWVRDSTGDSCCGGGMCCKGSGVPVIVDCTITYNDVDGGRVNSGGAIYCYQCSPFIVGCLLSRNEVELGWEGGSTSRGGGIGCDESSPIIMDCVVTENEAVYGAGISCYSHSSPTITGCTIGGNTGSRGGGIGCEWHSNPVIRSCIITQNEARGGPGGGLCCRVHSSPRIVSCVLAGNSADFGGGVYAHFQSYPTVAYCTIFDNEGGSGVYSSYAAAPGLSGCILWGNWAREITVREIAWYPSKLTVSYSDVEGGQPGAGVDEGCTLVWGASNIDANPLLADPSYGDFHLTAGSPCIDAGDPNYVPQVGESDMDGEARVSDGDGDGVAVVDMGADEFASFISGDRNCDSGLNALDVDPFAE